MFSAVVFTAGRTGSQLIAANLRNCFFTKHVIHTHNPYYELPFADTIPIISRRQNIFDSLISMLTASKVNKFAWENNEKFAGIEKFTIKIQDFENQYFFHHAFYRLVESRNFFNSKIIYYEDIIANPYYLMDNFGIKKPIKNLLKKSPYNSVDLIENIKELREYYKKLELVGVSDEQVEWARYSIVADLDDIKINHDGNRLGKTL